MSRLALATAALLIPSGVALAQGQHSFLIDTPSSSFTFSGSVTAFGISGPIQGNPSNTFNLDGATDLLLTTAGGVATSGQMVPGGVVTTVPDISAQVPNPIPFLPPAATVTVTGLQIEFISVNGVTEVPESFVVVGGNFSTNVVANLLAGTATINDALGGTTVIDLAGSASPAQFITGAINPSGAGFQFSTGLNLAFAFDEPSVPASGTLALAGSANADWRPLNSEPSQLSIAAGGTQDLILSTGGSNAGGLYLLVGSLAGTAPGIPLGPGLTLPLNLDLFLNLSLASANTPPFLNTFSFLDGNGKGAAGFALPGGAANPGLAGSVINWAYVGFDPLFQADFVSNAEPLTLVP